MKKPAVKKPDPAREIKRALGRIQKHHPELLRKIRWSGEGPLRVDLKFIGGDEMKRYNRKYRGKNDDTDVLSFPAPAPFQSAGFLGDLLISRAKLAEQAKALGHSRAQELRVLVTHGILHLLGLDHERGPRAARKMREYEDAIVGRAGLIGRAANRD